jgi:transposase
MTIAPDKEQHIRRLFEVEHWKVGTICAQLGLHEDVVKRVLGQLKPRDRAVSNHPRRAKFYKVAPVGDFIKQTLKSYPRLTSSRIYDMVCQRGYTGSERTLREYVAKSRPHPHSEAFLRIEPLIAEQAQVDWAHVGKVDVDGCQRPLWLFVMALAWSRAIWAEFVFDTTAQSLLRSLSRACEFFGGTCRQWLFDNAKSVVVERYGDAVRFHPLLVDLAGCYRAQLRVCAPYKPNHKGTVERAIRYIRSRHLSARTFTGIEQANADILHFIDTIAHRRPHPTMKDRTVGACFEDEKSRLLALPEPTPVVELVKPVSVDKTATVRFDRNRYSAPPQYAQRTLTLAADDKVVRFLDADTQVAEHRRCWGRGRHIVDPSHREQLIAYKRQARHSTGRDRLCEAVPTIKQLFESWVDAGRNVGSMTVQVLKLLDLYGAQLLGQAVDEALTRGTSDPGALAQLCEQHRTQARLPLPLDVKLGDHIPDWDVPPHALERYDATE